MKKILIAYMALSTVLPVLAQETYENAKVVTEDLNGTARYVGMGGAMEALGADISTISTNPAGIGLFRKSSANVSFGIVSQQDAPTYSNANQTNISFDQLGFVWANRTNRDSWVNFAFNYHKSRNFNYILSAADDLHHASQNKLTYAKAKNGMLYEVDDNLAPMFNRSYASCSQLDDIYASKVNYDGQDNRWYYEEATDYALGRAQKGYVSEYDFNLSGNIHNKVYLGLTVGIHDVHYRHSATYSERWQDSNLFIYDDRTIKGSGADVKVGAIFRPINNSAFRFGVYINTPVWYKLTTSNSTMATDENITSNIGESYDFKLYTPWKFGASVGHTIGSMIALGATYEYSDYGAMDTRYITETYDDGYGSYDRSESDQVMNRHTERTLKGVHTVKLGGELRPTPELQLRLGYNYISPMYDKDGYKDGTLSADGSYYSSATDYTNWGATHRITCGFGYTLNNCNFSLAYQYSTVNGDFSPFMNYVDNETQADDNIARTVKVSNKRHQLLFTLGYTF